MTASNPYCPNCFVFRNEFLSCEHAVINGGCFSVYFSSHGSNRNYSHVCGNVYGDPQTGDTTGILDDIEADYTDRVSLRTECAVEVSIWRVNVLIQRFSSNSLNCMCNNHFKIKNCSHELRIPQTLDHSNLF